MMRIGEREPGLEIGQQIDDLSLDRDVERADRLVEHQHLRLADDGAGDGDALALSARQLMRIAAEMRQR